MNVGEIEMGIGKLIDKIESLEDLAFIEESIAEAIAERSEELEGEE